MKTTLTIASRISGGFVNFLIRPRHTRSVLWFFATIFLLVSTASHGVTVGPQLKPKQQTLIESEEPTFLKTRMNIPSLRLAIPILDPNIPASTEQQQRQGIWPELRKAESVRTAFQLQEWVHRYNQFDSIIVSADATISADLYLLGAIVQSDGEIMRIRYQLIDATGAVWIQPRVATYRVELGWHQRNEGTTKDPFDPLYNKIAEDVYEALKQRAKAHVDQLAKNERSKDSRAGRLSDLQVVAATRDLAFAQFISPEEYQDSLDVRNNKYEIQYLPTMSGEEWARIQSVQRREDDFVNLVNRYYSDYISSIEDDYGQWQKDSFPIARQIRLTKRSSRIKTIAGSVLVVASAVAAKDGAADDGDESAKLATSVGALAGGSLLVSSFIDNQRRKGAVAEINELGRSLHNSLKPTRIDLNGKIVTLTGTVQDQFAQWRKLLTEMYQVSENDLEAVQILDDETIAQSE